MSGLRAARILPYAGRLRFFACGHAIRRTQSIVLAPDFITPDNRGVHNDHNQPTGRIPGDPALRERPFSERFPAGGDSAPPIEQQRIWLAEIYASARPRTGCYVCRWHGELLFNGHVRCAAPDGRTMGIPENGCAFWQREPGADDE
jgi:hypothetical protein